jgi:hypothetical protein
MEELRAPLGSYKISKLYMNFLLFSVFVLKVKNIPFQQVNVQNVEFEVFRAAVMKSTRDITTCSPLKVNRRFGGTSVFSERTTLLYIPEDSTVQMFRMIVKPG